MTEVRAQKALGADYSLYGSPHMFLDSRPSHVRINFRLEHLLNGYRSR